MALVRTLHERDIIQIGPGIELAVIYVRGSTVRLSIKAPASVGIVCSGQLDGTHHSDRLDDKGVPHARAPRLKPVFYRAGDPVHDPTADVLRLPDAADDPRHDPDRQGA